MGEYLNLNEIWECTRCGHSFITDGAPQFITYLEELAEAKKHNEDGSLCLVDYSIARHRAIIYGRFPQNIMCFDCQDCHIEEASAINGTIHYELCPDCRSHDEDEEGRGFWKWVHDITGIPEGEFPDPTGEFEKLDVFREECKLHELGAYGTRVIDVSSD